MKYLNKFFWGLIISGLFFSLSSCDNTDDDGEPITNDFRVLQVKFNDDVITNGARDLAVIGNLELVCSHSINPATFEGNLSISPAADVSISYDGNNSFAILTIESPLAYETNYTITLGADTYGQNGEASTSEFIFTFTTAAFEPPTVSLSTNTNSLFEGESATLTASLNRMILEEVSVELVFGGSATAEDFSVDTTIINIPSGSTSASVNISILEDPDIEGEESLEISLTNLVNAVEGQPQSVIISIGDAPPAIELKGVMSLRIGGTSNNGRAIHMRVLEDIPDLSIFGLGIANNGGGSDGREIDFPAIAVSAGDDILLVRDDDLEGLTTYFGDCFNDFDEVFVSSGLNFNGDDPFELYKNQTVIETYGDIELDGTGEIWEWTGSWAYKLNDEWDYATPLCSENSTSVLEADCPYPFCVPLQLQGALAILWDGSGVNGGKAIHVRANRDINDLSIYGLGIANNGGGTDGVEFTFPAGSASEGDHILVAREPSTIAAYFGICIDGFTQIIQSDAMNQNGDDAIELFSGSDVIETYGDANVDGTGEGWEYSGSWGYKLGSSFTYGGVDCAASSTTTQSSACIYPFCN